MPIWLTVGIGIVGSAVGGGITAAEVGTSTHGDLFAILLISIATSAAIVVAYRHFVQRRPITGPDAYKLPTRGVGVARLRQRLEQMGIDPNTLTSRPQPTPAPAPDGRAESLRKLGELRDEGVLSDEEYEAKKGELEREDAE
jgi:hypothetical protein